MKTTFKNFLIEETVKDSSLRKKPIEAKFNTLDGVKDFVTKVLMKKCQKSFLSLLTDNRAIYRGMTYDGDAFDVDYSKGVRKAQNTYDYYRLILDSNPDFAHFPKRSRSMVASSDYYYAKGYGEDVYYVFPYDDTKIGAVNEFDIFDKVFNIFDRIHENVANVSQLFDAMFRYLDKGAKLKTGVITEKDFIKNIDTIGMHAVLNWLTNEGFINDEDMTVKEFADKYGITDGKSFLEYFHKRVLNPHLLGFSLHSVDSFYSRSEKTEVWIGDKCVIVLVSKLKHWLPDIKKFLSIDPKKEINESFSDDNLSAQEAADIINEHGKEWRKLTGGFPSNSMNWIIYRGMKVMFAPDAVVKYPRSNRRPLTTGYTLHEYADKYFKKEFGIKFRSAGLFVSGSTELAKFYGDVYAIFPLGKVSFAWSEKVEDFTNESIDYRKRLLGSSSKDELSAKQTAEMIKSFDYHFNDDSLTTKYFADRTFKSHELMISCDEYVAVRKEFLPKVLNLLD